MLKKHFEERNGELLFKKVCIYKEDRPIKQSSPLCAANENVFMALILSSLHRPLQRCDGLVVVYCLRQKLLGVHTRGQNSHQAMWWSSLSSTTQEQSSRCSSKEALQPVALANCCDLVVNPIKLGLILFHLPPLIMSC